MTRGTKRFSLIVAVAAIGGFAYWLTAPTFHGYADFIARSKLLAGASAINCGRATESDDPSRVILCSESALRERRALFAVVDHIGIDSKVASAVVSDGAGVVHKISYDSSPCGRIFPTRSCPARLETQVCKAVSYGVKKVASTEPAWAIRIVCAERP